LKLVLVTETYAPEINGVAMTLGRLVDGLAARGHHLTIIRPRQRHESPRHTTTQRLACRHVRLPGFPMPGYPQLRIGFPARWRLQQLWSLNRPDLVHVATEGPLGASAITAARALGLPVTSSFHTNFDQYTRDYRLGWIKPVVAAWLRRVHNRTLRTFVPTRDIHARLAADGYGNLRILSRGVDTTLYAPAWRDEALRASWGAGPDDPVILHVGRMAAEKNYPLLFRAFDAVKTVAPRAKLVLVGDGPMLATYQRQRPDAIFTGFYTGTNLARHYASGDLYLHASCTETFGNVVTEALASALAVGAFDYAAAHEFVRDGDNGLVAPVGNEGAFIANAVRLAQDVILRAKLATAGRATAERLSWDTVVETFATDLAEAAAEFHQTPHPAAPRPSPVAQTQDEPRRSPSGTKAGQPSSP
jgi:glycosyltransferase involved in cell wall biosynthesis